MNPCTPAACNASICSFGIAGHQHRHLHLGADFLRQSQVLGIGTAQDDQVRIRPVVLLRLHDVEARASEEIDDRSSRARRFILTSPRLSSSTLGYRPVARACSVVR